MRISDWSSDVCSSDLNEIQFYFNRQDRPVNSGRITQIKDGSYGPSSLPVASDGELDTFIKQFKPADVGATLKLAAPVAAPSKAEIARSLFSKQVDASWRLTDGETEDRKSVV